MSIEAFIKKNGDKSNYEIMRSRAGQMIASYDLEASARHLGLDFDGEYVYLPLLDRTCRVRRSDGYAECRENGDFREADSDTAMVVYDILGCAEDGAEPGGEYAVIQSFSEVQNARSFAGDGMFAKTEAEFDREFFKLAPACEALGGTPYGKGDASFRIPFFKSLDVVLSFWRSDDEFPPSLSVMFDKNTLRYMHYETMWYAAFCCIHRVEAHF